MKTYIYIIVCEDIPVPYEISLVRTDHQQKLNFIESIKKKGFRHQNLYDCF